MSAFYYAEIDEDGVCTSVWQLYTASEESNMVALNEYDVSLLGKKWTGSEWAENPDATEPEPQDPPVTNEELQVQIAELQEQNVAIMMGLVDMFAAITTGGAE